MVLPTENNTTEMDTETVAKPAVNKKLANVLESIKKSTTAIENTNTPENPTLANVQRKVNKKKNVEIRGKPKSGRPWKEVKQK